MSDLLQYGREGRHLPIDDIVDMHGHLGSYAFAIPDLSAAGMVEEMDRLGIRKIICSHMRAMSADVCWGNRELLKSMKQFPDRILGYAALFPSSPGDVREEVEFCLASGFTGLKVHNNNGFPYTNPAYAPAYKIASERRLPILFHFWGREAECREMREIAETYPDASLLLAHCGADGERQSLEIVKQYDNVYAELAYSGAPRGLLEFLVGEIGADKIIWGSDAYFFSQAQQIGRVLGAGISDEDKTKILARNANRILARGQ